MDTKYFSECGEDTCHGYKNDPSIPLHTFFQELKKPLTWIRCNCKRGRYKLLPRIQIVPVTQTNNYLSGGEDTCHGNDRYEKSHLQVDGIFVGLLELNLSAKANAINRSINDNFKGSFTLTFFRGIIKNSFNNLTVFLFCKHSSMLLI